MSSFRPSEGGAFENPRGAVESYIQELHDVVLVVLAAAEMPDVRSSLIKEWNAFTKKGIAYVDNDIGSQSLQNPALTYLDRLVAGLRMSTGKGVSSEEAWTLNRLEGMLWDTDVLIRQRGIRPKNEIDVQGVMHDYLRACFPDFRLNPPIGGSLKTFKPDCGIASVGAAIEFKFVRTEKDVPLAFSGIAEDTAGYRGSRDWTRFYAVIYQAEPFISKRRLNDDMERVGAVQWQAFVVNGPTKNLTARKRSKEQAASVAKKRKPRNP